MSAQFLKPYTCGVRLSEEVLKKMYKSNANTRDDIYVNDNLCMTIRIRLSVHVYDSINSGVIDSIPLRSSIDPKMKET